MLIIKEGSIQSKSDTRRHHGLVALCFSWLPLQLCSFESLVSYQGVRLPPHASTAWITICKSLQNSRFDPDVQNPRQGVWTPFSPFFPKGVTVPRSAWMQGHRNITWTCWVPALFYPYFPSIPTDVAIFALSIKLHNKLLSKITLERNLILDSTYSCNICMKQVSRDLATPSLTLPLCPGTGGCQGHCSSSRNSPTSARRQSRGAALGAPTAVGMWHELTQLCASQPGTHRGKSPTSCTGGMGTRPFITT